MNFASAQYLGNPENVTANNGTIAGDNQAGGLIQNVYMVGNVNVEKQNSSWNTASSALIVGNNSGQMKNVIARGDRYVYSIDNTTNIQSSSQVFASYGGNPIGVHGGSYSEQNINYISPMDYQYSYINQTKADDADLWNLSIMNDLLNGEGQFQVEEDVQAGYYPKVIMTDAMMEKQPSITLPGNVGTAAPEVLDAVLVDSGVDEEGNDYVISNIRFINSRKRQVTDIVIDGLDCEILGYPDDGEEYEVQVKLTNPQVYHSQYELKSFTYKISAIGDATRTVEYGATLPNGQKFLQIEFWKSISNIKEWNEAFSDDKIDLEGNYQVFTGAIRGAAGEDRTGIPTISNYPAEKGYMIEEMSGSSVSNLKIDGVSFEEMSGVNISMGLVGTASETEFDHVEMKNVVMPNASASAGALTGTLKDSKVSYCSITGVDISTTQPKGTSYQLAVGGLLGNLSNTQVNSCYASDVKIEASAGGNVLGVGGLVGNMANNGSLTDAYAVGSIESSFGSVGGLAGNTETAVRRVWTDVSIVSVANNIGGVIGTAGKSMNLTSAFAVGEVYSKTGALDKVGRLYGSGIGTAKISTSRSFAYEGQMMNGQTSKDKVDAFALLSADYLSGGNAKVGWSRRIGIRCV